MKIVPGLTFPLRTKLGVDRSITVVDVRDGVVTYRVAGVLTLAPLRMPESEFAHWAENPVRPPGTLLGDSLETFPDDDQPSPSYFDLALRSRRP